jgi:ribosomal protein S18 acetylase RimI-like enzyme
MMRPAPVCELLDWDSAFFGVSIAVVKPTRLTPDTTEEIDRWARDQQVRCLYFYADPDDESTLRLAAAREFVLADVRLTYLVPTAPALQGASPPLYPPRQATPGDIPALKEIARVSHRNNRFHRDPHFPNDRCDAMYERWIERSCEEPTTQVFVAGPEGDPVGYLTAYADGTIGIAAVRADCRQQGWAMVLLRAALDWLGARGVGNASLATQAVNVAAQKWFQRCGGHLHSTVLVFHKWFE